MAAISLRMMIPLPKTVCGDVTFRAAFRNGAIPASYLATIHQKCVNQPLLETN
jgi:hypothetical protein